MLNKFSIFLMIFLLSGPSLLVFAEQSEKSKDSESYLRVWIGYNRYKMEEFNKKLTNENNKPIKSGINAGIELNIKEFLIPKLGIRLKAPICIEYMNATSITTHTYPGGSVTVDWKIPVVGVYVAPTILFKKVKGFYLRPIGIGYYNLGDLFKARLIVTDRPGRLELSGDSVGILSQIGMKYSSNEFTFFIEGGYRWLEFTDVFQEPKDNFPESAGGPPVQPGYLQGNLDYSGIVIKVGIGVRL